MKYIFSIYLVITLAFVGSCTGKPNNQHSSKMSESVTVAEQKNVGAKETTSNQPKRQTTPSNESKQRGAVLKKIVINGKPTIIDFSAVWCGPCKMMKPIFEQLASEYGDKINFVSIDIDENPDIANKYQIQSIPTFVFLDEDGREANRINGAVPESELRAEIANGVWY